jgi:hypothetical protein
MPTPLITLKDGNRLLKLIKDYPLLLLCGFFIISLFCIYVPPIMYIPFGKFWPFIATPLGIWIFLGLSHFRGHLNQEHNTLTLNR